MLITLSTMMMTMMRTRLSLLDRLDTGGLGRGRRKEMGRSGSTWRIPLSTWRIPGSNRGRRWWNHITSSSSLAMTMRVEVMMMSMMVVTWRFQEGIWLLGNTTGASGDLVMLAYLSPWPTIVIILIIISDIKVILPATCFVIPRSEKWKCSDENLEMLADPMIVENNKMCYIQI